MMMMARAVLVSVNVACIMMMVMVAIVVSVIVTGVMMMIIMVTMAMVVGVNVTSVIRTMRRRRRMVRRMVRRTVRRNRRAITAIDLIATSDDFSRCSHRKGGKNESNKNFELHVCLEYWTLGSVWLKKRGRSWQFLYLQRSCTTWINNQENWKYLGWYLRVLTKSSHASGKVAHRSPHDIVNQSLEKIKKYRPARKQETKRDGDHWHSTILQA